VLLGAVSPNRPVRPHAAWNAQTPP